jgi:hypothetical protein
MMMHLGADRTVGYTGNLLSDRLAIWIKKDGCNGKAFEQSVRCERMRRGCRRRTYDGVFGSGWDMG